MSEYRKSTQGPFYLRVAEFFDKDPTAGDFMAEDGDGGFIGAMHRMAREIERLRGEALSTPTSQP